jgi:hypothetical protein
MTETLPCGSIETLIVLRACEALASPTGCWAAGDEMTGGEALVSLDMLFCANDAIEKKQSAINDVFFIL